MNEIPKMVAPRAVERTEPADELMDRVIARTRQRSFDPDAWHVMQARDNAMIEDEIMNGAGSSKFVYRLPGVKDEDGNPAAGVSVIGARHLAATYGGIRHRIISSVRKQGQVFTFTSYPHEVQPMAVTCSLIPELAGEDDFYSALIEIQDVKKGNSIQMEVAENKLGRKRDGGTFVRPHYDRIAQAKAYRNGVTAIIPQDIVIGWKVEMLKLRKDDVITADVLAEKRAGMLRFGAAKAIPLDRAAVEALTLDQIAGLSDAAHAGSAPAFAQSAQALGLVRAAEEGSPSAADAPKRGPGRPRRGPPPPLAQDAGADAPEPRQPEPAHDPDTGEIVADEPPPNDGLDFG